MAHIYTGDGVVLSKVMRDLLNSWDKKIAPVLSEDLGTEAPSMMIQQLSAAEKVKTYINGDYIGVWSFAVYVRINAEDTAARQDAAAILQDLGGWLMETDERGNFLRLPAIDDRRRATKIEMTMTPAVAERPAEGIEDWQVIFALEYKSTRR